HVTVITNGRPNVFVRISVLAGRARVTRRPHTAVERCQTLGSVHWTGKVHFVTNETCIVPVRAPENGLDHGRSHYVATMPTQIRQGTKPEGALPLGPMNSRISRSILPLLPLPVLSLPVLCKQINALHQQKRYTQQ